MPVPRYSLRAGICATFMLAAAPASATHLLTGPPAMPRGQIKLQVGTQTAGTIDTVTFANPIPVNVVGNGVAQTQTSAAIRIEAALRIALGSTLRSLSISVNSATPLSRGVPATPTIPFTDFSWTSARPAASACAGTYTPTAGTADFPAAGSFSGIASQMIVTYTWAAGSRFCADGNLTFTYANTRVLPAGTYTGQVTFTASSP